ncbi:RluA family pseudouridine synthase [Lutibacter sp.]|uniref:RluA family pseudouridine synthase n=1 Tax=Lutibacter sp. TaxID=1925666 RepID=UPI002736A34A|nr:RluA family pseudouridine synthase [Lutibacter sp.]MDP3312218.1 RluA family pseudouridine synthase [Lutibacter sp.]
MGTWVQNGFVLELLESPQKQPKIFECILPIILEDNHIAIINKPAGLIVSGNYFKTVYNALPFNLEKSNCIDALPWPTPLHRLDSQTSGLLLIAKTKTAQVELQNQFKNNSIQKKYCTIVVGKVLTNQKITTPIEEKEAETTFEIIKIIKSLKYNDLSCLKVSPKTGRTHQIRIHLSSINYPIFGDKLYGNLENVHVGKGLFLAATELTFLHPKSFEKVHIKIDTPPKFLSLLKREERRWNTYNK